VAAAVYSYKTKHSTTDAIASAAVSDQRTISEILANEEIELGKDADLWITPEESGQQINVRTNDTALISELSDSEDLKISDVNVTTADPLAAEEELSSRQRHAAVSKVSPNVQAMHTRTSDGALIIETLDELNDADIDRLIESTGFAKVEVETLDETPRDSITIRGGAAMGSCTSGFAATYVGEIGFLSARHCSSPHSIFDSPSSTIGDFAPATKMSSTYKRDADISFFFRAIGCQLALEYVLWERWCVDFPWARPCRGWGRIYCLPSWQNDWMAVWRDHFHRLPAHLGGRVHR
jgi:hypothetical protein